MSDQKSRKEYLRDYHKKWYVAVMKKRRAQWFADNGPCVDCGSSESLEVDHVDPSTKVNHLVWSWSEKRRVAELEKCQVRCHKCHKKKSVRECFERGVFGMFKKKVVDGTVWCKRCEKHLSVGSFNRDKYTATGYYAVCKVCRKKYPSRVPKSCAAVA
jgi:hypothetical protein